MKVSKGWGGVGLQLMAHKRYQWFYKQEALKKVAEGKNFALRE